MLPSKVITIGLFVSVLVLNIRTALAAGAEVVVLVTVDASAVAVVTSAEVVVSRQVKLLHGHPPKQLTFK